MSDPELMAMFVQDLHRMIRVVEEFVAKGLIVSEVRSFWKGGPKVNVHGWFPTFTPVELGCKVVQTHTEFEDAWHVCEKDGVECILWWNQEARNA